MRWFHSLINLCTRRQATVAVALVGGLFVGQASAQNAWEVHDNHANQHLSNIEKALGSSKSSVSGRLDQMSEIGPGQSSGEPAAAPKEQLDATLPSKTVNKSTDERCPAAKGSGAGQQLWQLCQEIVRTEMAQYEYSMAMYELTDKRQKRLKEIENERAALDENAQGKLQDNSNKLLALMARMDIDRQQYRTYMEAYAARLQYLRSVRDMLSNEVLRGRKGSGLGSAAASTASLAGMATALEAIKSKPRN